MLPVRMLLMWSSPFNAHTNLFFESICKLQILSKFMYLDISLIYFLIVLMRRFLVTCQVQYNNIICMMLED